MGVAQHSGMLSLVPQQPVWQENIITIGIYLTMTGGLSFVDSSEDRTGKQREEEEEEHQEAAL